MDGQTDGRMNVWTDGWLGGWIDEWVSGWMGSKMNTRALHATLSSHSLGIPVWIYAGG